MVLADTPQCLESPSPSAWYSCSCREAFLAHLGQPQPLLGAHTLLRWHSCLGPSCSKEFWVWPRGDPPAGGLCALRVSGSEHLRPPEPPCPPLLFLPPYLHPGIIAALVSESPGGTLAPCSGCNNGLSSVLAQDSCLEAVLMVPGQTEPCLPVWLWDLPEGPSKSCIGEKLRPRGLQPSQA